MADHPWRPVPPGIWALTPTGVHELVVDALDGDGNAVARVASLKFTRSPCFNGPYPEANSTHEWNK